jgi:hypothetical protein
MGKWQMSRWFNVLPTPSKRHLDTYLADWRTFNLDILKEAKEVGASRQRSLLKCINIRCRSVLPYLQNTCSRASTSRVG